MNKSDHKKLTHFAIKNFQNIFSEEFQNILDTKGSLVSKGSVYEDELLHTPTRIHNWHFYKSEDSSYLQPFYSLIGKIHPSSRRIFTKYSNKIHHTNDMDKIFTLAGRLIHHIHDMSTPAHVIPIYHGPSLHPIHFPKKTDGFEKFSKNNINDYLSLDVLSESINKELYRISIEGDNTLINLYDKVANRTLNYLQSDDTKFNIIINDKTHQASTELFWVAFDSKNIKHNKTDGWGHYGVFNNCFGKTTIKKVDNKEYKIYFKDYKHIYIHLISQMIIDTLTVLYYVDNTIREKDDKNI